MIKYDIEKKELIIPDSLGNLSGNNGGGSYDEGYSDGMKKGKEIGFSDGLEEGKAEQKAKLSEITATENGVYEREDGYNKITVDVASPQVKLQDVRNYSLSDTREEITPSDDSVAMKKVVVNATNVYMNGNIQGQIEARSEARDNIQFHLNPITENGDYFIVGGAPDLRVEIPLQDVREVVLDTDTTEITPEDGATAMKKVVVDQSAVAKAYKDEGYAQGVEEGIQEGYDNGLAQGKVDGANEIKAELSAKIDAMNPIAFYGTKTVHLIDGVSDLTLKQQAHPSIVKTMVLSGSNSFINDANHELFSIHRKMEYVFSFDKTKSFTLQNTSIMSFSWSPDDNAFVLLNKHTKELTYYRESNLPFSLDGRLKITFQKNGYGVEITITRYDGKSIFTTYYFEPSETFDPLEETLNQHVSGNVIIDRIVVYGVYGIVNAIILGGDAGNIVKVWGDAKININDIQVF